MAVLERGSHVIIPAGALDDGPNIRSNRAHRHCFQGSMVREINDALPQFAEFPPPEFRAKLESRQNEEAR